MNEFNGFNVNIKDRIQEMWYKYKLYIIILVCLIIGLIIVLGIISNSNNIDIGNLTYKSVETIMKNNAEEYAKNNKITKNTYLSLNVLNLKIDNNLKCETISGILKESDNYYPYLVCDKYQSDKIKEIVDKNASNKSYGSLKGDNPYVLTSGEYIEPGYEIDNKYKVNIKGNDIENGVNIISYYILENNNYVAELKRIVIAEDITTTAPIIELVGNRTISVPQNSEYKDPGYKATDKTDGDITNKVKVTNAVDTKTPGTYKITYSVINSKNKTTTVTRTIIVNKTQVTLAISHTINPLEVTGEGVTITLDIKGNDYLKTILPNNTESTSTNPTYVVYKNGTYEFVIYDNLNNSEVYEVKISNAEEPKPVITNLTKNGVIITVTTKKGENPIAGYLFTSSLGLPTGREPEWILSGNTTQEIAKYPGIYYVYVKDTKGKLSDKKQIEITMSDLYDIGPKSRTKDYLLRQDLPSFLKSKGDSIDNYNKFIANSVLSAGLFTRDGVVASAVAATNYLYIKYRVQIPYISNLSCTATRYNKYFGANPRWGISIASPNTTRAKECMGTNVGLDCASFVGWAIHNGGFTSYNTPGSYYWCNYRKQGLCGTYSRSCAEIGTDDKCLRVKNQSTMYSFYQTGSKGDLLYNNDHVVLVLDHYDDNGDGIKDGMYIMEAYSSVGIKKFSYADLYKSKYDRYTLMANYYKNSVNYACTAGGITIPGSWAPISSKFTNTNCTVKEG